MENQSQTETELQPAPENVVQMKRSVLDAVNQKRLKKAEAERSKRKDELKKKGFDDDTIEQIIAQEAYDKLPIDRKVAVLQNELGRVQSYMSRAMKQLATDMVAIRNNQEVLADTFDINLKALEAILLKLGLDPVEQQKIVEEVSKKFYEHKAKEAEERAKAAKEKAEKEAAESKAKKDREEQDLAEKVMKEMDPQPII